VKKVLFITHHRPNRSPGQRFRFEQYLHYLEANGIRCHVANLFTPHEDRTIYSQGHWGHKAWVLLHTFVRRLRDVRRARDYDLVFLYREAHMAPFTILEWLLKRSGTPVIFDFDDAIWLLEVSEGNQRFRFLKHPGKTKHLIRMADGVFAGNQYLADYARHFNPRVWYVPTTIDTGYHRHPDPFRAGDRVTIGWTGTQTTLKHFLTLLPVIRQLKQRFGDRVRFLVIGDKRYEDASLDIVFSPWNLAGEIDQLCQMDVGVMPLPDNDWTRGKCGFKGLQYMALEIPAVLSPVGVNREIIEDGVNGFLAGTDEEWLDRLSRLVEDANLRRRLGAQGRQTVEERFSVDVWKDRYLAYFREAMRA
jgi:glycosyltransferase involved in cell wall biosynthesis